MKRKNGSGVTRAACIRPTPKNEPQAVTLPKVWFEGGGEFRAIAIQGSLFADAIDGDCIALVDISRRDPDRLVGCIVATRTVTGIEPRWLGRDGDVFTLLTLKGCDVRLLRNEGENSILGRIVKWVADAPSPRVVICTA